MLGVRVDLFEPSMCINVDLQKQATPSLEEVQIFEPSVSDTLLKGAYDMLEPSLVEVEEIDEWGLQAALDEMNDAPAGKVVEVLQALLSKTPTSSVLEDDDYEDALQSQLCEDHDSPVGAMARKVCAAWKRHGVHQAKARQATSKTPGAEAMALLEGYAALAQLQSSTASTYGKQGDSAPIDIV
jgi:hypothetical protein